MNKLFTILFIIIALLLGQTADKSNVVHSRVDGAPAGHTGSPADGKTCATVGCHAGPSAVPTPGLITSNIPPTGYIPGQTYTMNATASQAGLVKFGFQVSPQALNGTSLGTLVVTNTATTKIVSGKYITHRAGGVSAPGGSKTWSFDWIAPVAGTGDVTFYGAFNYTNNNGSSSGDAIKSSSLTIMEDLSTGLASMDDPYKSILFPIPAKDYVTVRIYVSQPTKLAIDILDLQGRQVGSRIEQSNLQAGNHELLLDLPGNMSTGIYYVKISSDAGIAMKRLVINK